MLKYLLIPTFIMILYAAVEIFVDNSLIIIIIGVVIAYGYAVVSATASSYSCCVPSASNIFLFFNSSPLVSAFAECRHGRVRS